MEKWSRNHLVNIQERFSSQTGVHLPAKRQRFPLKRMVPMLVATTLCLSFSAFALSLFSSLDGDELALCAEYQGNGIVTVSVENRSNKKLEFQDTLKLMRWKDCVELAPSAEVEVEGTTFAPHSDGVMTIDLSDAYDMEQLEEPLAENDHYYFVLTNNGFAFGQDWICSVDFSRDGAKEEITPTNEAEYDLIVPSGVLEELRSFFEQEIPLEERQEQATSYFALCEKLFAEQNLTLASSVKLPRSLDRGTIDGVFDKTIPAERQGELIGFQYHSLDAFGHPIGSSATESALVLSAYLSDSGAEIPLFYLMTYPAKDLQENARVFVGGRLFTAEELKPYLFYEDEAYVCYELSALFYDDLLSYAERVATQRGIVFNEQMAEQIQATYDYFKNENTLASLITHS